MANISIEAFISKAVRDFLGQFDTDGSKVIEEANGELAKLQEALNGNKAQELGNTDLVVLRKNVAAPPPNETSDDNVWDQVVDNYNSLDITKRREIRDRVIESVTDKYSTMTKNILPIMIWQFPFLWMIC